MWRFINAQYSTEIHTYWRCGIRDKRQVLGTVSDSDLKLFSLYKTMLR